MCSLEQMFRNNVYGSNKQPNIIVHIYAKGVPGCKKFLNPFSIIQTL